MFFYLFYLSSFVVTDTNPRNLVTLRDHKEANMLSFSMVELEN